MKDIYYSKKVDIFTRRILIGKVNYTVRPSFVMPYLTGTVDDVEKAMFLRKFSLPFWAIAYVFGRDPMYWHRMEQSIGRNSIVGTTIKNPDDIPVHLAADEKHTKLLGEKVYVATTVGAGCILGASIAEDAGEASLTKAYSVFKEEVECIHPEFKPLTVNTDGWKATQNAWAFLFQSVVIICCFLHVYIKIRDRSKKKHADIFQKVSDKIWDCYHATSKRSFCQRIRRLLEWCKTSDVPSVILKPIKKLRKNINSYKVAFDFPGAHRTSNMLDRLMQRMDRHLFNTQYFHGDIESAQLSMRGWVLINNFAPSNPYTVKVHNGLKSPAERLNTFSYHENWLQNLLVSASLGGFRPPPLNPL
jgi:hypothetical protein